LAFREAHLAAGEGREPYSCQTRAHGARERWKASSKCGFSCTPIFKHLAPSLPGRMVCLNEVVPY